MALFSRKKSKAKKAIKEEEKKATANAKPPVNPEKTPQRGCNGKINVTTPTADENVMHAIPAPSQLPRHYHSPQNSALATSRSRDHSIEDQDYTEDGKDDNSDSHSPIDSGYASPESGSRGHSRTASTQQLQRDRDYLLLSKTSMPQLTLGEELAQEPAFAEYTPVYGDVANRSTSHHRQLSGGKTLKPSQSLQIMRNQMSTDRLGRLPTEHFYQYQYQDGIQQRMIQQSMPMRPSSVPAQALQPRHERMNRPSPQRSLSPGPVLQNTPTNFPSRMRMGALPDMNSLFDWESAPTFNNQPHPSQSQSLSPTSRVARNVNRSFDQDEFSPSLNILNGLKVNKRGLILDEEGDPIGELFEGDIIDCVRQKADAYGDVLDEYGRVVGRVRTLSVRPTGTDLHRSATTTGNVEQLEESSPLPAAATSQSTGRSGSVHRFDERQHIVPQQHTQAHGHDLAQGETPASPTRATSAQSRRDYVEQEDYISMRPYGSQEHENSQRVKVVEEVVQQQQPSALRQPVPESSLHRSESLPSVPESHSTAELALSDDGTSASEESRHVTTEKVSTFLSNDMANPEEVFASHENAKNVQDTTVQQSQVTTNTDEVMAGAALVDHVKAVAGTRQTVGSTRNPTTPFSGRSTSDRTPPTVGLPPVPEVPRDFLESRKPAQVQPAGFPATQGRVKSSPPLSPFPGRGPSVGLAGGGFNGPLPSMNRRLTAPGFPGSPAMGVPGMNARSPLSKRTSAPLGRSALSTHETTPPESEDGSPQSQPRPAFSQPHGQSRSQTLQTSKSTQSVAGAGKPRKVFAHAGQSTAGKQAGIVVEEVKDDKKLDKKKKGVMGLFGRKN